MHTGAARGRGGLSAKRRELMQHARDMIARAGRSDTAAQHPCADHRSVRADLDLDFELSAGLEEGWTTRR